VSIDKTNSFLETLKQLDTEATTNWGYKEWEELINESDANLANLFRNNTQAIIELVEAAECLIKYSNKWVEAERKNGGEAKEGEPVRLTRQALSKLKGDV